jgi:hypothetical protein
MKKIVLTSCVLIMCIINSFSQAMERKINFVISIDNKVVTTITDAKLFVSEQNEQGVNFAVGYVPSKS